MKYTSLAIVLVVTTLSISIAGNTRSETAMNDTEAFGSNQLYTSDTHPEEFCLAQNIYYESRTDNLAGKAAVADVVRAILLRHHHLRIRPCGGVRLSTQRG